MCSFIAEVPVAPPGYVTFRDVGDQSEGICNRDVTSPINELDGQSNSSRGVKFSRMSTILNASAENMRYNVILFPFCVQMSCSLITTCPPWGAAAAAARVCLISSVSAGRRRWRATRSEPSCITAAHSKHLQQTVLSTSHHVCRTLIKQRGVVHVDPINSSTPKAGVPVTAAAAQVTARRRLPLDLLLHTLDPRCVFF